MEKYVTANVATNLYWLGRYLERVAMTLREIAVAYDKVIDVDKDAGVKLYRKYDIELSYTNAYDFLNEAIFGDHSANLLTILTNARENAIICRHLLDSEAFGEIIALHALFKDTDNNHLEVDYKCMDHAQSLIGEIWNARSHREHQELSDSFFRIGKIVEEADHRIRHNEDDPVIQSIIQEIDTITERLVHDHKPEQKPMDCKADLLSELNSKIDKIIIDRD
jgi:uncharacterized alpha-E superfamily protein